MINTDPAYLMDYFHKINSFNDSFSSLYRKNSNASSYYQYKLFDFNGDDLNLESLSYSQNKEKVQLFKEDELEKEKYNLAKTLDEESIDEKVDDENFFGPHKGKILFILF